MKLENHDDFGKWSLQAQELLKETFLNDKTSLTDMIAKAIDTPSLRSKFETHQLLDYLVIFQDGSDNRIRLHLSTDSHLTRVHDHRFDFSTLVLAGSYQHRFYELKKDIYSISNEEYALNFQNKHNVDSNYNHYSPDQLFETTCIRTEMAQDSYSISNRIAHSVYTKPDTVSVIVRSAPKKVRSFIYDMNERTLWWRFGRQNESQERISSKIMTDEKLRQFLTKLHDLDLIHQL